jgi:uncharacterized membrane protein YidH (DUF202 family)
MIFVNNMDDKEEKSTTLKTEVLDKMAVLVTTAFGLVAALAWNDAIKAIFKEILGDSNTIVPMLIYAIMVTIIAVILIILVARAVANAKNN